jgi:hypothetical protein
MKRSRSGTSKTRRAPVRRQRRAKPKGGKRVAQASTKRRASARGVDAGPAELEEIEELRASIERMSRDASPPRWNANPEEVRRGVMKLVLTLVELIRQLLERQAIRRMEADTLTPEETEAVGLALMRLEETIRELAEQFDLKPDDLNLDLGPIGKLI